ncbi:MAG: hypothetical protein WC882_04550 [Candidatus Gracilibacteria bacterium]
MSGERELPGIKVCFIEDDPKIVGMEKVFLARFSSFLSDEGHEMIDTVQGLRSRLSQFGTETEEAHPLLLFVDSTLKKEERVCPEEVLRALIKARRRVAVIFQSAAGFETVQEQVDGWKTQQKPGSLGDLSIGYFAKPVSCETFGRVVALALGHLLNIEVSVPSMQVEAEMEERTAVKSSPSEKKVPVGPIDVFSYSNLGDLIRALPTDASNIVLKGSDSSQDSAARFLAMAHLLDQFLDKMQWLTGHSWGNDTQERTNFSFSDVEKMWSRYFPADRNESRRRFFEMIFEGLEGANIIVSGCVHDVNNIFSHYDGQEPSLEVWKKDRKKIGDIVWKGLNVFREYLTSRNPDCFFENQNVGQALAAEFSEQENSEGIFLQNNLSDGEEDLSVNLPAGTLASIFRTFRSNYWKVRNRCSTPSDARMEVEAHVEGNEIVISFQNNLGPFSDKNLEKLFDELLGSEHGHGSGTGLNWTAKVAKMGKGSITSYHRRDDGKILEKKPGSLAEKVLAGEEGIPPVLAEGMNTRFELRFPIVMGRK